MELERANKLIKNLRNMNINKNCEKCEKVNDEKMEINETVSVLKCKDCDFTCNWINNLKEHKKKCTKRKKK